MFHLDHLAYATPSLDDWSDRLAADLGVRAMAGGSHPGKGTRNALLALGPSLYLAIDGPDPAQPLAGTTGAMMSALKAPQMNVYVLATADLSGTQAALAGLGYRSTLDRLSRKRLDGVEVAWLSLTLDDAPFGLATPILTQWLTDQHPAADSPAGCRLSSFSVATPRATELRRLFGVIGYDQPVTEGPVGLEARIDGPAGSVTLRSA